jgi:hypothetical protein
MRFSVRGRKVLRDAELPSTACSCVSLDYLLPQMWSHTYLLPLVIRLRCWFFLNHRGLFSTGGLDAGRTFAVPTMRFELSAHAPHQQTTARCIHIPLFSENGIGSLCWAAGGFERAVMSFELRYRALMSCRQLLSQSYEPQRQ